jgi:hypothetical protein
LAAGGSSTTEAGSEATGPPASLQTGAASAQHILAHPWALLGMVLGGAALL